MKGQLICNNWQDDKIQYLRGTKGFDKQIRRYNKNIYIPRWEIFFNKEKQFNIESRKVHLEHTLNALFLLSKFVVLCRVRKILRFFMETLPSHITKFVFDIEGKNITAFLSQKGVIF